VWLHGVFIGRKSEPNTGQVSPEGTPSESPDETVNVNIMNKIIHKNSDGWKMVATAKGVSIFGQKSKLHQVIVYAPVWGPALLLLPVFWKDPKAYWIMLGAGLVFGVPLCRLILRIPTFSVNKKFCIAGTFARWDSRNSFLMSKDKASEYIYVFNRNKKMAFPVWRSSEKSDRDLVESYLSRFIPKEGNSDLKENS
jgi:hypothetical protein